MNMTYRNVYLIKQAAVASNKPKEIERFKRFSGGISVDGRDAKDPNKLWIKKSRDGNYYIWRRQKRSDNRVIWIPDKSQVVSVTGRPINTTAPRANTAGSNNLGLSLEQAEMLKHQLGSNSVNNITGYDKNTGIVTWNDGRQFKYNNQLWLPLTGPTKRVTTYIPATATRPNITTTSTAIVQPAARYMEKGAPKKLISDANNSNFLPL